jgi:dihydroorotate dehydrogenase electron transfer subunit
MAVDVVSHVLENTPLGDGYFLTEIEAPAIARSCVPGQFVMAGSCDPSELLLRRPFSVCLRGRESDAGPGSIALLYRVIGRGTAFLSKLRPGEAAAVLGPLGRGFSRPEPGRTPVIVAGGVGIAAFPFLAETLIADGRPPVLLYGARSARDFPLLDWFRDRLETVTLTTDDGSAGERALVTGPLERLLAETREQVRLYVCGPNPMMKAVASLAARFDTPCEVALETPMACGYGVCVGCVVEVHDFQGAYGRYRRVCVDGPVFDAAQVRWDAPVGPA